MIQMATISECRYRWLRVPATTFVITPSPSRSNRRDGFSFSAECRDGRSHPGCAPQLMSRDWRGDIEDVVAFIFPRIWGRSSFSPASRWFTKTVAESECWRDPHMFKCCLKMGTTRIKRRSSRRRLRQLGYKLLNNRPRIAGCLNLRSDIIERGDLRTVVGNCRGEELLGGRPDAGCLWLGVSQPHAQTVLQSNHYIGVCAGGISGRRHRNAWTDRGSISTSRRVLKCDLGPERQLRRTWLWHPRTVCRELGAVAPDLPLQAIRLQSRSGSILTPNILTLL